VATFIIHVAGAWLGVWVGKSCSRARDTIGAHLPSANSAEVTGEGWRAHRRPKQMAVACDPSA